MKKYGRLQKRKSYSIRYKISFCVDKDHIHMLLSCPTTMAPSEIAQKLKGRTSRILQEEFPELRKRYWGQHMWGRGYFCGTVGEVDQKTIENYIEHQGEEDDDNFTVVE